MNTVLTICLRGLLVLFFITIILISIRAIWWLVRPTLPFKKNSDHFLVEPFVVVKDGEVQKQKGEAFARLLSSQIRQINGTLTTPLSLSPRPLAVGILVDRLVPKQYDIEPITEKTVDIGEVKPFGVDVIGIASFVSSYLDTSRKVQGTITLNSTQADVFAEITPPASEKEFTWDMTVTGSLEEASRSLAHRIVKDLLTGSNSLASFDDKQFEIFVGSLKNYQLYARSADDSEAENYLAKAAEGLDSLRRQNLKVPAVYSYLASIRTLQSKPDIDGAVGLLEAATALQPNDEAIRTRLDQLKAQQLTLKTTLVESGFGASLADQQSFNIIRLGEAAGLVHPKKQVKIAVLVNGFNRSHESSATNIILGESFVQNEGGMEDTLDYGTFLLTYLASAVPNAEILVVKVLSDQGVGTQFEILKGLNYAAGADADIVLNTLGSGQISLAEETAVKNLEKVGILVIAAGGNGSDDTPVYPAAYETVLGVGATDTHDEVAKFSSFGPSAKLFAPGFAVSFNNRGQKVERQGTSYSAALTAAVAALVLETNPSLTPARVRDVLTQHGKKIRDSYYRVDALEAVNAANALSH